MRVKFRLELTCPSCKKEFLVMRCEKKKGRKFCSKRCSKMNILNPQWKRKPSLRAIHLWVRRRLPIANLCQKCNINKPHDLANISQKYYRNLTDWEWLCRKCHMKSDGRINNLKQYASRRLKT